MYCIHCQRDKEPEQCMVLNVPMPDDFKARHFICHKCVGFKSAEWFERAFLAHHVLDIPKMFFPFLRQKTNHMTLFRGLSFTSVRSAADFFRQKGTGEFFRKPNYPLRNRIKMAIPQVGSSVNLVLERCTSWSWSLETARSFSRLQKDCLGVVLRYSVKPKDSAVLCEPEQLDQECEVILKPCTITVTVHCLFVEKNCPI